MEQGFSLSFLNEFNKKLLDNRKERFLRQDIINRARHPWLRANTVDFDPRLHQFLPKNKRKSLMNNLNDFIRESDFSPLITAAIAYGQLCMIHPWRYANGRTTGALIPYIFNTLGLTKERSFFLSSTFRKNKEKYYLELTKLLKEESWQYWIKYFLESVKKQAVSFQKEIDYIVEIYPKLKREVEKILKSLKLSQIIKAILRQPIFTPSDLYKKHSFSSTQLYSFIGALKEHDYLKTDNRKNHVNYMVSEIYPILNM